MMWSGGGRPDQSPLPPKCLVSLLDSSQPLLLAYRHRGASAAPSSSPGPLWPALSALPVLACWLLFASAAMPVDFPLITRLTGPFGPAAAAPVLIATWAAATVASVVALIAYGRRPQPWHTTLCLGVHLAGLLLTLLLAGGLAVLALA